VRRAAADPEPAWHQPILNPAEHRSGPTPTGVHSAWDNAFGRTRTALAPAAGGMHILVAEDDRDIAELISHYLRKSGWSSHIAGAGDEALAYARSHQVDVVVLDLMLPGMDGLEVCRALRADDRTGALPIVMLTARGEEGERIRGLDLGADDYIAKPFSPNELVARIRAVARRSRRLAQTDAPLRFRTIEVDLVRHTVSNEGEHVALTAKEFLLLRYLLEHRGRVLSRDRLLGDVWGYQYTGGTRTVDVHIRRLRQKLPPLVDGLVTVKQFGYKLADGS
jgi:DNA-binding response OmpR family regulator